MRHVDLCSGIGGFALGFEWAGLSQPVQFCDIEPWSRKILKKHWPDVPIAEDVKELASDPDRNVFDCDILSAGYPCQPFSVAGKQKGFEDDRHIWPYIREIVAHKRPTWCVFENVYGHVALGLDEVLLDLETEGYSTRTFIVPACGVNAPHRRDRLWIIAHSNGDGQSDVTKHGGQRQGQLGEKDVENANGSRRNTQSLSCSKRVGWKNNYDTDQSGKRSGTWVMGNAQHDGTLRQELADPNGIGRGGGNGTGRGTGERQFQSEKQGRSSLGRETERRGEPYGQSGENFWAVEPDVGRVAHGIPRRVDRLKGLGNAIVPQIAMQIGLAIKGECNE